MFLLAACSREATHTVMEMNNSNFSGTEVSTIEVRTGDLITVSVVTRSGTLDFSIADEFGNVVASGHGVTGNDMSFGVHENGEHTITINGDSHFGRFNLSIN